MFRKRRMFFTALLVLALGIGTPFVAFAAPALPSDTANVNDDFPLRIEVRIGSPSILANSKNWQTVYDGIPAVPCIEEGRAFLPLRSLMLAMQVDVLYHEGTSTTSPYIEMTRGKEKWVYSFGTPYELRYGNKRVAMDVNAFVNKDNLTMVPLRFVSEAFGYKASVYHNEVTGRVQDIVLIHKDYA